MMLRKKVRIVDPPHLWGLAVSALDAPAGI